jgi:type I restriction enzyme M protein
MQREVLPHVSDAWVDESKTKIGYEIPFTRHFYEYVPPRPLAEIEREIKELEDEIRVFGDRGNCVFRFFLGRVTTING